MRTGRLPLMKDPTPDDEVAPFARVADEEDVRSFIDWILDGDDDES